MLTIKEVREMVGDNYWFHQSLSIDELKRIINSNEDGYCDNVPMVLEAGNLDIEVCIYVDGNNKNYLGYFCCCLRTNGVWSSYDNVDTDVNLDTNSLEDEMLRVLIDFAEREHLKFV